MLPIVGHPSVVSFGLSAFKKVFSRPQLRHFANYLTGLMVCRNRTVKGINDSILAHLDQSALNHFLTDSTWSDEELDKARYELINSRLKELGLEDGVLIVDDTIAHKTGKSMEGVGIHYDISEGKYTLGHQIVTTHYARGWASVPVDFEFYIKRDEAKEGFRTKLEIAKGLSDVHFIPLFEPRLDMKYPNEVFGTLLGLNRYEILFRRSAELLGLWGIKLPHVLYSPRHWGGSVVGRGVDIDGLVVEVSEVRTVKERHPTSL